MKISVVICAHNPKKEYLDKVIESLRDQTLSKDYWELILIDNNSKIPLQELFNLSWHPSHKIVIENNLGLIHARMRGVKESEFEIIVTVDDDTPLFHDYLEHILNIYTNYPELGMIGGRTVPLFEGAPPKWINDFHTCLAIRDLGEVPIFSKLSKDEIASSYPEAAAILIAPRRDCMLQFLDYYGNNTEAQKLGRKGSDLASGEDNDINLFIYKNGYGLGYFPQLKFYHIIPEKRTTKEYLSKLQYSMNKSWVKVLHMHGILPWDPIKRKSVAIRKLKAWILMGAWKSQPNYIKWKGACGTFDGLAELNYKDTYSTL